MKLRAIIVDDEALARRRLRQVLDRSSDVAVVAECANGVDAVRDIETLRPELVFLDVRMPELDGFGVLEAIGPAAMPAVVFVTAFDDYAVRAFDAHAVDYLLKPFDDDRAEQAIARARDQLRRRDDAAWAERLRSILASHAGADARPRRMIVRSGGRTTFVPFEEIDWIEADGSYVQIHCGSTSHLLRESMTELETRLAPERFVRVHRSALIPLDKVRELRRSSDGDVVVLDNGVDLRVSQRYRDALRAALHDG